MNKKTSIVLSSYDVGVLDNSAKQIIKKIIELGTVKFSGPFPLNTKKERITLLTSPHKHKKAQKNFVRETHRRIITLLDISSDNLKKLGDTKIPITVNIILKFKD